jgi:hypothetical protein
MALRKAVWGEKQERISKNALHNEESPVTIVVPAQDPIKDLLGTWEISKSS